MNKALLALLLLASTAPAWAGPAGAVNCKAQDNSPTLTAYDIAVREPHARIISFRAQSEGRNTFRMINDSIKPEVIDLSEKVATIRYKKPNGQNAQAVLTDLTGSRRATVEKVEFYNSGMTTMQQRKGSVVIYLDDETSPELLYDDCTFQGGLVRDWEKLWSTH